jgi:Fur family transcriptional regulator, ferric uptake regulator
MSGFDQYHEAMRPDVHEVVATRLRADGQRYTESRQMLVEILVNARRPLSIPEVLAAGRTLPQSSAYRNLVVLEQAGAVGRVLSSDGAARYELAEGLVDHHHHLICVSCGSVEDFRLPFRSERSLDRALGVVAEETGFRPSGHRFDILGVCAACPE